MAEFPDLAKELDKVIEELDQSIRKKFQARRKKIQLESNECHMKHKKPNKLYNVVCPDNNQNFIFWDESMNCTHNKL